MAAGAMVLNVATPAFATTIEISGNGSYSDSEVDVEQEQKTEVNQYNTADIKNSIDVNSNTGDNEAEDNTGGNVGIDTGDATADVDVSNLANFNAAELEGCGCIDDLLVKIAGNGADSDNDATVNLTSRTIVDQDNTFRCGGTRRPNFDLFELFGGGRGHDSNCADVDVYVGTGDNDANKNTTHDGDPSVETGNADADVTVENTANKNIVGDVDFDFPDVPSGSSSLLLLLWALISS